MKVYCKNCGHLIEQNAAICLNCGAGTVPKDPNGKEFAIVSMILGIISITSCSAIPCGVMAVIFGVLAKKKGYPGGMANAGLITGIISICVFVLLIIAYVLFIILMVQSSQGHSYI